MRLFVTALVFLGGLLMAGLAISFLVDPVSAAANLGIETTRAQGFSTLRGDLFGFFGIIGICMIWGAWKSKGDLLLVPAIIMVLVIIGRIVSAVQDGSYDGYLVPMAIEALIAALLLQARAMLPHHKLQEVGD